MVHSPSTQRCSKCKQVLPLDSFGKNKSRKNGFDNYCLPCRRVQVRIYQQTEKGKAALKRGWVSAAAKAKYKRWKNSEKGKAYLKWYRHTEKCIAKNKRFWKSQNGKMLSAKHASLRYNRKMKHATLTAEEWNNILNSYNHCCAYCQTNASKLEIDHYVPLCKGGTHTKENVVPACRHCNAMKQSRHPHRLF